MNNMEIEWPLVLFTALTGCGGWMTACIAVADLKKVAVKSALATSIVAFVMLAVGGTASVFHLAHPTRIMYALSHPTSGIFVEAALIGVCLVALGLYIVALMRKSPAPFRMACVVAAGVIGVVLSFMAGHSYMMEAIPSWDNEFLPIGYLFTAAPSGVALYAIVCSVRKEEGVLAPCCIALLVAGVLSIISASIYGVLYVTVDAAVMLLWGLCVVVGGVLPTALAALVRKKPELALPLMSAGFVCAIAGSIAYRCVMWLNGEKSADFFAVFNEL